MPRRTPKTLRPADRQTARAIRQQQRETRRARLALKSAARATTTAR